MSASSELVMVLGCDDRYAMPLAVTLSSALRNTDRDRPARVVIIDGGISDDSRRRLERVIGSARSEVVVEWHEADNGRFDGLKVTHWGSTANYLRLLIPEIVGTNSAWVLYLDSDLLVRADVGTLLDEAADTDAPVLAVGDYHHRRCATVYGEAGCERIGINPDSPYFNSGVLAINVPAWRDGRVADQAISFVRKHSSVMKHSDQDALNAVLNERWQNVDPSWNVMVPSVDRFLSNGGANVDKATMIEDGRILHFTSSRKPWIAGYVGPAGLEYRRELRDGGWFDSRGEWARWHIRFWLASPLGWSKLVYGRTRKRAALLYRRLKPGGGDS